MWMPTNLNIDVFILGTNVSHHAPSQIHFLNKVKNSLNRFSWINKLRVENAAVSRFP